jgi:hypothetical protein
LNHRRRYSLTLMYMSQSIYSLELRQSAKTMLRNGMSNAEVARRLRVPKGTVGYWKHLDRKRHPEMYPRSREGSCPACHSWELNDQPYAYLLGLYLGDGHIVHKHRQHTLSIACADAWPGLIDAAEEAMKLVMPTASTWRKQQKGCTAVTSCSQHWVCLFPQHGPGRKHTRPIALEEWQEFAVDEYPEEFIRGLIHSDGCRSINWTTRTVAGERKRYEYPRYLFTNESVDIRNLFTGTLDDLGIEWRYNNRNCISIAKRGSVAALDWFVGPKY